MSALMLTACSTKKNTQGTRMFHSLTARFNTLHNGEVAFVDGVEAQTKGHKDDYTSMLPMYVSTNKATASVGKSSFETAITKAEKAIKLHSIKRKPERKGNAKMKPKEKEFRARKEFNPYLRHAWQMMGEAQFHQGNFVEAASTFNYMLRLYATQPEVTSVAKAWLARCYVALEWPYDAEDVLTKMSRDSITPRGMKEMTNTQAAFYVATKQYDKAVPYLQKTIRQTRHKVQKARLNFLLGQVCREQGDNKAAYKALSKVIKSNPPYELAFNARILQSEVTAGENYKATVKRLQRMAKSDKNKPYVDQVYYALGNVHLAAGDTAKCISAWEKGNEESTQSTPSTAVLLLRLSELYWEKENYIDAQRTYQKCIGMLDKERDDYKEAERRSKILDELAPPLSDVKLQDSLQALAKLPEKDYLAAIDRVIEALKKKEREEAKRVAANGTQPAATAQPGVQNAATRPTATNPVGGGRKGAWYFYNPQTVQKGKEQFQRKWGNRPNEDNWQRSNKRVASGNDFGEYNYDEYNDSTSMGDDAEMDEARQRELDSLANDPHHREYYLKQIPFTDEQLELSHQTLSDGLYKAGVLEGDKLGNYPLAERTLKRLLADYPDFEQKPDVYYHLFLVYGRMGDEAKAEEYRQMLMQEYAKEKLAILLANPNYEMIARNGKHIEDSIYVATYEAYRANRYGEVEQNYKFHTDNFPEGPHRGKMMFIHAMSNLYQGNYKDFLAELKEVVSKYPKDEVTEMAQYMVKGLEEGRTISGDKYDASSIWSRRTAGGDSDSTQAEAKLSEDLFAGYVFVLAYPTKSVNEKQLMFEMARYNFTSFVVRNFDIEIVEDKGLTMMCVKGFQSYDEVHIYAQQLYGDAHMRQVLSGLRSVLISEDNFKMLGKTVSFDDYDVFYDEKLKPLPVPDAEIDEQFPIINEDDYNEEDYPAPKDEPQTSGDDNGGTYVDDDDWLF